MREVLLRLLTHADPAAAVAPRYGTMVGCPNRKPEVKPEDSKNPRWNRATDEAVDPDLLIDFTDVSLRRDGHTLVGPVTWSVELDERWVIIGANGAGKTSLLRSRRPPSTPRRVSPTCWGSV